MTDLESVVLDPPEEMMVPLSSEAVVLGVCTAKLEAVWVPSKHPDDPPIPPKKDDEDEEEGEGS